MPNGDSNCPIWMGLVFSEGVGNMCYAGVSFMQLTFSMFVMSCNTLSVLDKMPIFLHSWLSDKTPAKWILKFCSLYHCQCNFFFSEASHNESNPGEQLFVSLGVELSGGSPDLLGFKWFLCVMRVQSVNSQNRCCFMPDSFKQCLGSMTRP